MWSELYHSMFWNAPVFFFSFCDTLANLQISLSSFFLHCFWKCHGRAGRCLYELGKMLMVKLGQLTRAEDPIPSGLGKGLLCVGSARSRFQLPGWVPVKSGNCWLLGEVHRVGVPQCSEGPRGLQGVLKSRQCPLRSMALLKFHWAPRRRAVWSSLLGDTQALNQVFPFSLHHLPFICYRGHKCLSWSSPEALSFLSDGPICIRYFSQVKEAYIQIVKREL